MKNYHIKSGYSCNPEYLQFDDRDHTMEWQAEVYMAAQALFEQSSFNSVLDIGCGSGFKLVHFFPTAKTLGLDLEPNLSFLRQKYPERDWRLSDFSKKLDFTPDLVIASDIIEHLIDPDLLLTFIRSLSPKVAIISTPERDIVRGLDHLGPPPNPHHIREWNEQEFCSYLSEYFTILSTSVIGPTQFVIGAPSGFPKQGSPTC